MNYLAHLLLADHSEQWQLGALLGDFVRGRASAQQWPADVLAGIEHHRALDSWTDAHSSILNLKQSAPGQLRRYMGIVLDLYLDAWLCRHWADFHHLPLDDFTAGIYHLMARHENWFPERLQRFCRYARKYEVLGRYHEASVMDQVLSGVAGRLSRPGPLADARNLLSDQQAQMDRAFAEFFPAAVVWSDQWVDKRKSTMSGS